MKAKRLFKAILISTIFMTAVVVFASAMAKLAEWGNTHPEYCVGIVFLVLFICVCGFVYGILS